jgi:hypothetical protein
MSDSIKTIFFGTTNICGLEYWCSDQKKLERLMNNVYIKHTITTETTLQTVDYLRAMNTEFIRLATEED